MSFQPSTGKAMKFYRNTGTRATPVWVLVADIGDLSIPDMSRGLAELKRRSNNFTKNLPSLIQTIGIEFKLLFGLDATTFAALKTAFFAGTVAEYAVMNDDITNSGSQGLRLPAIVENFPWDQPLEEVSAQDIRLACGYMVETSTELDPVWLIVA